MVRSLQSAVVRGWFLALPFALPLAAEEPVAPPRSGPLVPPSVSQEDPPVVAPPVLTEPIPVAPVAPPEIAPKASVGEVVDAEIGPAPEVPLTAIPFPVHRENLQPIARMPLIVDEPDFKATAIFPETPIPQFDQNTRPAEVTKPKKNMSVPQEEGAPDVATPEEQPKAPETQEALIPELANAVARDKGNKKKGEMVPVFQEIANKYPNEAAAHYHLGLALVKAGDKPKGLAALEQAILKRPENFKYWCDYGLVAIQAGWIEKGLVACQKAALGVPANARYQSALGDAYLAANKPVPAAETYLRAVHLEPHNPTYINNLGIAHMRARAYKRAAEIFDEAIKVAPQNSGLYCSRGMAFEQLRNPKKAIEDYKVAIALDKNNAFANYLLAGVYSDPDDPTYTNMIDGVMHAERACKLTDYKNPQYIMGMARALRVARRYDLAIDMAKKAIAIDPRPEYQRELAKFESLKNEGYGFKK